MPKYTVAEFPHNSMHGHRHYLLEDIEQGLRAALITEDTDLGYGAIFDEQYRRDCLAEIIPLNWFAVSLHMVVVA